MFLFNMVGNSLFKNSFSIYQETVTIVYPNVKVVGQGIQAQSVLDPGLRSVATRSSHDATDVVF